MAIFTLIILWPPRFLRLVASLRKGCWLVLVITHSGPALLWGSGPSASKWMMVFYRLPSGSSAGWLPLLSIRDLRGVLPICS